MFIVILCVPVCDVKNFASSRFPAEPNKSDKNVKILRTERAFEINKKYIHHFSRAFFEANKRSWEPGFNIVSDIFLHYFACG